MDTQRAPTLAAPPRNASWLERARAFVVCRPCVAAWALYLVAAFAAIALWGSR